MPTSTTSFFIRRPPIANSAKPPARRYDIFVNLCEGYLDWDIPSLDVIQALDSLGLPYTGPCVRLYDPSKELMKYVAHVRGVSFPAFAIDDCDDALRRLRFPHVRQTGARRRQPGNRRVLARRLANRSSGRRARAVPGEFGQALIEEYIPGREFTVLVAADGCDRFQPLVLQPIEFSSRRAPASRPTN